MKGREEEGEETMKEASAVPKWYVFKDYTKNSIDIFDMSYTQFLNLIFYNVDSNLNSRNWSSVSTIDRSFL